MKLRILTFEEFGKLMITWNGMQAIIGGVTESYTYAGLSMGLGLIWIILINQLERL